METLNSLKYANRARNIRNKVIANQDKTSRTIAVLRTEIQNLQFELMEYRQGKRVVGEDGTETSNDMYHENAMLTKENSNLRTRIKALQETVDVLTVKNSQLLADKEVGSWIRDGGNEANNDISAMVQKYILEVEELRARLCESENVCEQLRKENTRIKRASQSFGASPGPKNSIMGGSSSPWLNNPASGISPLNAHDTETGYSVQELIDMAKKDLEKNKEERKRKSSKAETSITPSTKTSVDEDKDANSADDEDDDSEEEGGGDEYNDDESDDTGI
jgi:kinesin family protein 4/21/27